MSIEPLWSVDLPGVGALRDVAEHDQVLYCMTDRGLLTLDAADPERMELLGGLTLSLETDFETTKVALAGAIAYCTIDSRLYVCDVSNPRDPSLLTAIDLASPSDWPTGIREALDHVYVAGYHGSLWIVDVSVPTDARLVNRLQLPVDASIVADFEVRDGLAYVATSSGCLVVDLSSSPRQPSVVSTLSSPRLLERLDVDGHHLYLAGESGLTIVDVSSPTAPNEVASITAYGPATDVLAHNGVAYAMFRGDSGEDLVILDVDDPLQATTLARRGNFFGSLRLLLGRYLVSGSFAVTDVGVPTNPTDVAYYSPGPSTDVDVCDNVAFFAAGHSGVWILDISKNEKPRWVGSHSTVGHVTSVALSYDTAFIGDRGGEGFVALDITDPSAPMPLDSILGGEDVRSISVAESAACVLCGDGTLYVVAISQPSDLKLLGSYQANATDGYGAEVALVGDRAFVVLGPHRTRIEQIDLTDPREPSKIADIDLSGFSRWEDVDPYPKAHFLDSGRVFSMSRLLDWPPTTTYDLFDFSDPNRIVKLGRLAFDGTLASNAGDTFYFIRSGSLNAFKTAGLANPQHVTDVIISDEESYRWQDFKVQGDDGYGSTSEGLVVFDLSLPSAPLQIGGLSPEALGIGEFPSALATAQEQQKVIIGGSDGVRIVDVSDPTQPVAEGTIPLPVGCIVAQNDRLLVASARNDWSQPYEPVVSIVDDALSDTPIMAGHFSLGTQEEDNVRAMVVDESLVLAVTSTALAIVDLEQAEAPSVLSELNLFHDHVNYWTLGAEIVLEGRYAYVACDDLLVIDISDPVHPTVISRMSAGFTHVALEGGYVYLWQALETRLVIVDVSNPAEPRVVGGSSWHAGADPGGFMALGDEQIYVALQEEPLLAVFNKYYEAPSRPLISASAGGLSAGANLSIRVVPGVQAVVQRSPDLATWQDWFEFQSGRESLEIMDPLFTPKGWQFYRVLVE